MRVRVTKPNKQMGGGAFTGTFIPKGNGKYFPYYHPTGEWQVPSTEVRTGLSAVPDDQANLEAEGGETAYIPDIGGLPAHFDINGPRHSEGGVALNLPQDSFIYSDTRKMLMSPELTKFFGKGGTKKYTPADLAKQYDINRYRKILQDPDSDPIAVHSAELMIANYNKKLGMLALAQEAKKGFPDGIPAAALPYMSSYQIEPKDALPLKGTEDQMAEGMDTGTQEAKEGGFVGYGKNSETHRYYSDIPYQNNPYGFGYQTGGTPQRIPPGSHITGADTGFDKHYNISYPVDTLTTNQIQAIANWNVTHNSDSKGTYYNVPATGSKRHDPNFRYYPSAIDKPKIEAATQAASGWDQFTGFMSPTGIPAPQLPPAQLATRQDGGSKTDDEWKAFLAGNKAKQDASLATISNKISGFRPAIDTQASNTLRSEPHFYVNPFQSENPTGALASAATPVTAPATAPVAAPKVAAPKAARSSPKESTLYGISLWPGDTLTTTDPKTGKSSNTWNKANLTINGKQVAETNKNLNDLAQALGFDPSKEEGKDINEKFQRFLYKIPKYKELIDNAHSSNEYGTPQVTGQMFDGKLGVRWLGAINAVHPDVVQQPIAQQKTSAISKGKEGPYNQANPNAPWWLQDVIKTAGAAGDFMRIKKYTPWAPNVTPYVPEPVFMDPTRALAANSEQANIATQGADAFSGPQAFSSRASGIQGKAAENAVNILSQYENQNVNIADQASAQKTQIYNRANEVNAGIAKELYDKTTIANQQFDNSKNQARGQLRNAYIDAITNRGQTQALNTLYPNYQVDPITGGLVNFYHGEDMYPSNTQSQSFKDSVREALSLGLSGDSAIRYAEGPTYENKLAAQAERYRHNPNKRNEFPDIP